MENEDEEIAVLFEAGIPIVIEKNGEVIYQSREDCHWSAVECLTRKKEV